MAWTFTHPKEACSDDWYPTALADLRWDTKQEKWEFSDVWPEEVMCSECGIRIEVEE